ncbi:hypothetical protein [Blattabacterium cuenoti]|uniref:hypothetical protein n=1 Tax=Blattabacterium cuenoti TaxID=1653831 RepID=UPI00293BCE88|nr:hypothetical protein [Blattabacterium cuenoti]
MSYRTEKKDYFIVKFIQKAGVLKEFVNNNILGTKDDITYFEYSKKNFQRRRNCSNRNKISR